MTEVQDPEAIFHGLWAALERGDVEAAAEHFAEDGVIVDHTDPDNPVIGRAAITELLHGYFALLPDLSLELTSTLTGPDRLAAELVLRGTPRGQSTPVTLHYGLFHVYRDGKIRSEHLYVDSSQMPDGL